MSTFPYAGIPHHQVWKRAVTDTSRADIDPQLAGRFTFDRSARVASAGSCFAVRIADELRAHGYTYFVTETGLEQQNYGRLSARYGEIYTTLQLNQTVLRAFGHMTCAEPAWKLGGRLYDPLRPRATPGGFAGIAELQADRERHEAAIRRAICESDVFIFTLGLTETWCSRFDGTAFPLCPGAGIGSYSPERYVFRNLAVDENLIELEAFLALAWSHNPGLRVILTLSPVPLAATFEPQHVVAATMYSKSVLRVVAETLRRRHAAVDYFASYEIVASHAGGSENFAANGRDVSDVAVARVMRSFFRAFTSEAPAPTVAALPQIALSLDLVKATQAATSSEICNEAYLASFIARSGI